MKIPKLWNFLRMCYWNRPEREIGGKGIEEKEGYHSVIKIATEKLELPSVSTNQNNFIKSMGKIDLQWNYEYYWIITLSLLHTHPFYMFLSSRKLKAYSWECRKKPCSMKKQKGSASCCTTDLGLEAKISFDERLYLLREKKYQRTPPV